MKKLISLLFSILLFAQAAFACDQVKCYYATSCVVPFELYITDATTGAKFVKTAAHAAGDTYLMKDEGADTNTTNAFVDEGAGYSITLTATETTAARDLLRIEDQSGPQIWADKCINIETVARTAADNGLAYYSFPTIDLVSIDGQLTTGNNATLNLKKLNIVNSAGDAFVASATGSNGRGALISGNGSGAGARVDAGATGVGLDVRSTSGNAVLFLAGGGGGAGFAVSGQGSGPGLLATGGATGPGIKGAGGATSGAAITGTSTTGDVVTFAGTAGNANAVNLTGQGSGNGLKSNGGATGNGFAGVGGATSGDGFDGSVTSGFGFDGTQNGNITGNLSGSVGSVTGAVGSVTGNVGGNVVGTVGPDAAEGTAQSVGASSIQLANSETYGDNALADNNSIWIVTATTGKGQLGCVKSNVSATDTATMTRPWKIALTGVVTYRTIKTPNCNVDKWPLAR